MQPLSLVDNIFLRQHRGHGPLSVMQGLWMFDEPVDVKTLTDLHRGLAMGPLNRRVVIPRVPGARTYFIPYATIAPLRVDSKPIPRGAVVEWADERAQTVLNPEHGIGWELSAVTTDDGGMIVSLLCSHVLADAHGLIEAVQFALNPDPRNVPRLRAPRHPFWAQLKDAAGQWWRFIIGSIRALYTIFVDGENRDDLVRYLRRNRMGKLRRKRAEAMLTSRRVPARWQEPTAIIDIPVEQWDAVAARSGGTANSLLVAVVSNLMYTAGSRLAHESAHIGIPVRLRTQSGGNPLTLATVRMNPRGTRYGELFQIRKRIRKAIEAAVRGENPDSGSPAELPVEALSVFPERLVYKLVPGTGECEGFASNVGAFNGELSMLGQHKVVSTAARSVHHKLTTAQALGLRADLSAWLIRSGMHYTLSVVATDPIRYPDARNLRNMTLRELEKWGLSPQSWDSNEPGLGIPGGPSSLE